MVWKLSHYNFRGSNTTKTYHLIWQLVMGFLNDPYWAQYCLWFTSMLFQRGALGFSVLRFWLFFRSVFRFLCQNTSVFRFWYPCVFGFFLFCPIWVPVSLRFKWQLISSHFIKTSHDIHKYFDEISVSVGSVLVTIVSVFHGFVCGFRFWTIFFFFFLVRFYGFG